MQHSHLDKIESKQTCPNCDENKLITSDNTSSEGVVFYHCINCDYVFFANKEQREFHEYKSKNQTESPWNAGIFMLIFILLTVLAMEQANRTKTQATENPIQTSEVNTVGAPVLKH